MRDLDLALTDADRLDEDQVEEVAQQAGRGPRAATDPTQVALRRLRAEEDAPLADREADAHAIAEKRPARLEARRVDREDRDAHGGIGLDEMHRHATDEGRLAGAGRAGEPDDPARRWRRGECPEERGLAGTGTVPFPLD